MKKHKIYISRKNCIGCGSCAILFPEILKMSNEDGLLDIKGFSKEGEYYTKELSEEEYQRLKEEPNICPSHVINIE